MKLSIIIPCYNCERYIRDCLTSVLESISADDEVICVDDGSKDRTAEIIRGITDARILLIPQQNLGPGAARNAGIDTASGEQILFVDADDMISPALIRTVKSQPAESLVSRQLCMKLVKASETPDFLAPADLRLPAPEKTLSAREIKLDLLNAARPSAKEMTGKGYDLYGPVVKTYCCAVLKEYGIRFPADLKWGEDICFNLQYTDHIKEVSFLPVNAYWYRIVSGSLIHQFFPEKHLDIQLFLKTVRSLLGTLDEETFDAFRFLAVKQYIYILEYDLCNRANRDPFAARRQKAWMLIENDSIIRDGMKNCRTLNMSVSIELTVLLIRLKWFGLLDLILKLYASMGN